MEIMMQMETGHIGDIDSLRYTKAVFIH